MRNRSQALRGIPLFRNLDEKDVAEIAGLLIDRKFPRDAVIYEDGSIGDYMYIIEEGQYLYFPVVNYVTGDHGPILELLQDPACLLGLSDGGAHCTNGGC